MILLLTFVLLVCTQARVIDDKCVSTYNLEKEGETLLGNLESPYQLAIDYDTNTLFFSHNNPDKNGEVFIISYLNLKNNETKVIPGISGGFANAVDYQAHKVYFGGRDGIYEFDSNIKRGKHIGATSDNIWQMFYKNGLYYSEYPNEKIYIYEGGDDVHEFEPLANTKAMLIAIDNNHDVFFVNSTGLFFYKTKTNQFVEVGEYNVNGFSADIDGNLYFSTPDGIFYIDESNGNTIDIKQLIALNDVYGLAIEGKEDVIVALSDKIIRLKMQQTECIANDKTNIDDNNL